MNFNTEPTLDQIDDYTHTESKEKRWAIRGIIAGILIVGGAYSYLVINSEMPSDYIGTTENPGIGVKLH